MPEPTPTTPAAKPKRRALLRALRFATFVAITLAAAYGLLCAWYYSQEINPARNIAAELNAPILKVPEEQRAWTHYRRALEVLEPRQENESADSTTSKDWPATVAYLKRNAQSIEMIRAASKIQPFGALFQKHLDPADVKWSLRHKYITAEEAETAQSPVENPDLFSVIMPFLSPILDCSQALQDDSRLAAQEGDPQRLVADIEALHNIARQTYGRPTFVQQLVAATIQGQASSTLARHLAQTPQLFTDASLSALATQIAADLQRGEPRIRLRGEKDFVDDVIQRSFTDDGQGSGYFTIDGYPDEDTSDAESATWHDRWDRFRLPIWAFFVIPNRQQVQADSDRYFEAADQILALDNWADFPAGFVDDPPHYAALGKWNKTWDYNLGVVTHARACNAEIRQHLGANLIAIALIRFHRQHNRWPATLEEIPAELLAKMPLDQFNGQPLRYKLQDAAPLIYSVGPDRDDDNGTPPVLIDGTTHNLFHTDYQPDGDQVLWPPKQPEPEEEVDEVEDVEMDAPDEENVEVESEMDANESTK